MPEGGALSVGYDRDRLTGASSAASSSLGVPSASVAAAAVAAVAGARAAPPLPPTLRVGPGAGAGAHHRSMGSLQHPRTTRHLRQHGAGTSQGHRSGLQRYFSIWVSWSAMWVNFVKMNTIVIHSKVSTVKGLGAI